MVFGFSNTSQMKNIVILLIVVLFLSSPVLSFAQPTESCADHTIELFQVEPRKISEIEQTQHVQVSSVIPDNSSSAILSVDTSVLPSSEYPIQHHPRVIGDDDTVFVLSQTKNNNTSPSQLTATYSLDNGETWGEQMTIADANASFRNASIDATGDHAMQAYGSHRIDDTTGIQLIFGFPNISDRTQGFLGSTRNFDMNGWFNGKLMVWDPSYWQQLGNTATAGYPHGTHVGPYKNFHGLTVWAGHDGTDWSYYYFCETDETQDKAYKILWKNYLNATLEDVAIDIDLATGWQYDVYQLQNKTTGESEIYLDLLYIEPGNPTWYSNDDNYGPSLLFKNCQHPDVKASNGFVYLVCEKENDIFLYYSTNKGFSFNSVQLTDTPIKESSPVVTAKGNVVTVSYVQHNNVFMMSSANAGVDWSEPVQVNDEDTSVSDQHGESDIDEKNMVWTNTEMNSQICYDSLTIDTPVLTMNALSGGFTISAIVENKGMVNATNTPYSIRIDDGILFSPREIKGTITIPAGETRTIQTENLLFGFGRPTITLTVGSVSSSTQASLLLCYFLM